MNVAVDARLRADGVSVAFRDGPSTVQALDAVDLAVHAGEVVALAGPSGAGKSTLVHVLVGWRRPDRGTVHRPDGSGGWDAVAVVPQELGLVPELSLVENITIPGRLGATLEGVDELVRLLGLDQLRDRRPDETSLGEQQRAAVARAAASDPLLLVADEPTSHLDEEALLAVVAVLRRAADRGSAVLVSTHDDRVLDRADRVVHLRDGRVVLGDDDLVAQ